MNLLEGGGGNGLWQVWEGASQVGNRRYARGRAYDPDRFGKQEQETPSDGEIKAESGEPAAESSGEVTAEEKWYYIKYKKKVRKNHD